MNRQLINLTCRRCLVMLVIVLCLGWQARAQDAQVVQVLLNIDPDSIDTLPQAQKDLLGQNLPTLEADLAAILNEKIGCWRFAPNAGAGSRFPLLTIEMTYGSSWYLRLKLKASAGAEEVDVANREIYSAVNDQVRTPETFQTLADELRKFLTTRILEYPSEVRNRIARAPLARNGVLIGAGNDRRVILPLSIDRHRRLMKSIFEFEVDDNEKFLARSEGRGADFPNANPLYKGILARPVGENGATIPADALQRLNEATKVNVIRLKEYEEPDSFE